MKRCSLFLMFLGAFVQCAANVGSCPCEFPSWYPWSACNPTPPKLVCEAATRTRLGTCGSEHCMVVEPCLHVETCFFSWGSWSAYGPCNKCAQIRARQCYRQNSTVAVDCKGSKNKSYQIQRRACSKGRCGNATTVRPHKSSVPSSSISTTSQSTEKEKFTSRGRTQTAAASGRAAHFLLNNILLVGLICTGILLFFAFVAIAVLLRLRHKRSDKIRLRRLPTETNRLYVCEREGCSDMSPSCSTSHEYQTIDLRRLNVPLSGSNGYLAAKDTPHQKVDGYLQPISSKIATVSDVVYESAASKDETS